MEGIFVFQCLSTKSNALLLKNWRESSGVFENYHASGVGRLPNEAPNRSDNFYHWGASLGYIYLLEGTSSAKAENRIHSIEGRCISYRAEGWCIKK